MTGLEKNKGNKSWQERKVGRMKLGEFKLSCGTSELRRNNRCLRR